MSNVDLQVDWCSYQAAKYAVMHWHYSKAMPTGKILKIGVWEDDRFIGAVLFSRGANKEIGSPYGLKQTGVCELTRVALDIHKSPVSRVVTAAMKMLRKQSPALRLIVSYADPLQLHNGTIYQAMNWVYVGKTRAQPSLLCPDGSILHKKTAHGKYGSIAGLPKSDVIWKYKYLYPLDRAMRRQIEPLAKPYPKRADVVQNGNTADDQLANVGSIPTVRSDHTCQMPELIA